MPRFGLTRQEPEPPDQPTPARMPSIAWLPVAPTENVPVPLPFSTGPGSTATGPSAASGNAVAGAATRVAPAIAVAATPATAARAASSSGAPRPRSSPAPSSSASSSASAAAMGWSSGRVGSSGSGREGTDVYCKDIAQAPTRDIYGQPKSFAKLRASACGSLGSREIAPG